MAAAEKIEHLLHTVREHAGEQQENASPAAASQKLGWLVLEMSVAAGLGALALWSLGRELHGRYRTSRKTPVPGNLPKL